MAIGTDLLSRPISLVVNRPIPDSQFLRKEPQWKRSSRRPVVEDNSPIDSYTCTKSIIIQSGSDGVRTRGHLVKSQVLYLTKLQTHPCDPTTLYERDGMNRCTMPAFHQDS